MRTSPLRRPAPRAGAHPCALHGGRHVIQHPLDGQPHALQAVQLQAQRRHWVGRRGFQRLVLRLGTWRVALHRRRQACGGGRGTCGRGGGVGALHSAASKQRQASGEAPEPIRCWQAGARPALPAQPSQRAHRSLRAGRPAWSLPATAAARGWRGAAGSRAGRCRPWRPGSRAAPSRPAWGEGTRHAMRQPPIAAPVCPAWCRGAAMQACRLLHSTPCSAPAPP